MLPVSHPKMCKKFKKIPVYFIGRRKIQKRLGNQGENAGSVSILILACVVQHSGLSASLPGSHDAVSRCMDRYPVMTKPKERRMT